MTNQSGKLIASSLGANDVAYVTAQGAWYPNYWKNIGNGNWSWGGASLSAADALAKGPTRHLNTVNCLFADGHVKSLQYTKVISDICLWATDANGPHPACN